MFLGEVVGTAVLILLGDGVVAGALLGKSKSNSPGWIVITVGWAMAVLFGIIASLAVSGGVAHLNPAVTIALAYAGLFEWGDVGMAIVGQFLGAAIGATLVWLSYLAHWEETSDAGLKLAVFSTGPAIRKTVPNLITEAVGTAVLVIGVLVIGTASAPAPTGIFVALLVLSIGLSLGGPTGYAINPARDLGPRIMHFILPIAGKGDSDWGYAWIPVVGPIVGGVLGVVLLQALGLI